MAEKSRRGCADPGVTTPFSGMMWPEETAAKTAWRRGKPMTGVVAPKRVCPPAKKPDCGERRSCVPDDAQAVQPFPTEGVLFDNLDLRKPELNERIGGHPGAV